MSGTLYLVPNTLDFGIDAPSGLPPLSDVLPLAVIQTAARLPCWAAENAKTTRAFLKRVDAIVPLALPLQSIDISELPRPPKGSKAAALPSGALDALLKPALEGRDMGLISEAGIPAVADPGAALVEAAHAHGIQVVPMSGPSSLLLALAASGLNGQSFAFVGYLPVDPGERAARIRELEALSRRARQTQILIETPYRNEAMLSALVATLGPTTKLSVSCGLTVAGGWTRSGAVSAWRAKPASLPKDVPAVFCFLAG